MHVVYLTPVLILVVVEDGLVHILSEIIFLTLKKVLILVVVEDGLVHLGEALVENKEFSLNPCCSGRWSCTK